MDVTLLARIIRRLEDNVRIADDLKYFDPAGAYQRQSAYQHAIDIVRQEATRGESD